MTDDPSLHLQFSQDSLLFDTVFTYEGSSTRTLVVRNPHQRALMIHSAHMQNGHSFRVNLDGEQDLTRIHDISVPGGDSLFIFVRATIDPDDRTQPLYVEDKLVLEVGDHTEQLVISAYGWDVELIDSLTIMRDTTLSARKPYLVRNYIYVDSLATLTIQPGSHLFFMDGAQLLCQGGIIAEGTAEEPISFSSHRLDDLYTDIPYLYVGGKWAGIYLLRPAVASFDHVDIISANVGLFCQGTGSQQLTLLNSRIHNHDLYGLVMQDINGLVANSEISNAAHYCVYLSGGQHQFIHTTIASYFNHTRFAIQTTMRNDTISALYIHDLSKSHQRTELHLHNSIVAGVKRSCMMLATPLPQYYTGSFSHSYLQTDTIRAPYSVANVWGQRTDTVFVNTYYADKGHYYDFTLDSLSRARDIADSVWAALYPLDRRGFSRFADGHPDAGCYEYIPNL